AVFGTTSSGKSTLLNLLIGAELLPSGVPETTRGRVTIRHHPKKRLLTSETSETAEANASEVSCPRDIHKTLADSFTLQRHADTHSRDKLAIDWPTRLGALLRRKGMRDMVLELIDSPGLRFVDDSRHTVEALSGATHILFIFGANETDDRKQFTLLRE